MTPEERFERIERNLYGVTEKMDRFATGMEDLHGRMGDLGAWMGDLRSAHMELETAQLNQAKAHERVVGIVGNLGEKISNLTILMNQLVERDLRG